MPNYLPMFVEPLTFTNEYSKLSQFLNKLLAQIVMDFNTFKDYV